MFIYVDASAVLRALEVRGSEVAPLGAANLVASSELVEVEIRRALERTWVLKHIDSTQLERKLGQASSLLKTFHLFPLETRC